MYARGMPVREIQSHLHEIYGVDVSPDLISRVTDEVMDEVRSWQSRPLDDRKIVASDLKQIYRAETVEMAALRLDEFEEQWGDKYPPIGQSWRRNWEQIIPFFAYPEAVRKIIYTTNAIESLNMSLRKIIKNRGHFPNDDAAVKLLYLALRNAAKKWTMPARTWKHALNQFAVLFYNRFPASMGLLPLEMEKRQPLIDTVNRILTLHRDLLSDLGATISLVSNDGEWRCFPIEEDIHHLAIMHLSTRGCEA